MNHLTINEAICAAANRTHHALTSAATGGLILFGMLFFTSGTLFAQFAAPPPAPAVALRSEPELETMVGPIALYPDPLIAQILPAATLPAQIVIADRFVGTGNDPNLIDQQPWDFSVKAVARYPEVLKMLDTSLDWTTALGQAFLYQPQDVMDAIQRLRAQAVSLGNLQTTPQQQVVSDSGIIEVLPANPAVIYVPVYEPGIVFSRRRPSNGFFVSFGLGFSIGAWLNHDLDWHNHNVIVWGAGHARPSGWWKEPPQQRFRDTRVTHDYRVWQPRAHDIHGDRGWNAPAVHRQAAPPPRATERPESRPRPQAPPRPVESRPKPSSGALIGVDSTRNTRQFSNRGQQSRQINRPTPAPRAPAVSRPAPVTRPAPESHNTPARDANPGQRQSGRK